MFKKIPNSIAIIGCIITLLFLSLGIFSNSWKYPFVFDDESLVVLNDSIHEVKPLEFYFSNSLMNSGGLEKNAGIYFRPLVGIIYSLLWKIQDGDPYPFHLLQWILHTTSSIFIFFILLLFSSQTSSLFIAALFLSHPLNSEIAIYVSDLADALSLNLGLLSLLFYLKWEQSSIKPQISLAFLSVSALFLGLLAKETSILFLIAIGFISATRVILIKSSPPPIFSASRTHYGIVGILFCIPILIYLYLRIEFADLKTLNHNLAPIAQLNLSDRAMSIPKIIFSYLIKMFFPYSITLQSDWVVKELNIPDFYCPLGGALLVLVLFGILVLKSFKKYQSLLINGRSPLPLISLVGFSGLFFGGLAIHLQIIPLGATTAIRWYSPSFFAALTILLICYEIYRDNLNNLYFLKKTIFKYTISTFLGLIIVGLSVLSYQRVQEWENGLKLYSIDVERQPDSYLAQNNLGVELFRNGKIKEATPHFLKSIELYPTWATAWNNLGATYHRVGNLDEAEKCYLKAVKGNYYLAIENYAIVLFQKKNWTSLKHFLLNEAIPHYPNNKTLTDILKQIPDP